MCLANCVCVVVKYFVLFVVYLCCLFVLSICVIVTAKLLHFVRFHNTIVSFCFLILLFTYIIIVFLIIFITICNVFHDFCLQFIEKQKRAAEAAPYKVLTIYRPTL